MKPVTSSLGPNRTGVGTSPIDSKEMLEGVNVALVPPGGPDVAAEIRREYAETEETVGSVPPPTTLKGVVITAVEAIKGNSPVIFLDKLGERLAFERTGTRLYEAILIKLQASENWQGGPTLADVQRFRDEERAHFLMVREAMEEIGADPTAMTPAADVIGVASTGLLQVVTDPRTTLPQSLQALLTAELTDNDGWDQLIELARIYGKDDMAARFESAKAAEEVHLAEVRRWVTVQTSLEAQRDLQPAAAPDAAAA
jgi:hypothetical protein